FPLATVVESVTVAGATTPEPPSVAVQLNETLSSCQVESGEPQLTTGFFLSTLLPAMGPAVVELLTASATTWLPVEALASSVLAGTEVLRVKVASAGLARPEPPSEALHVMSTSAECQAPSALPQTTTGFCRSTLLPEMGPAVAELPAESPTWCEPVEALASSESARTEVGRVKLASAGLARPE